MNIKATDGRKREYISGSGKPALFSCLDELISRIKLEAVAERLYENAEVVAEKLLSNNSAGI